MVDDPALQCLAWVCDCLLQRPLHLGLDGRARCPDCRKRLVSATSSVRRTVLRLVLLWLKACSQLWPIIVRAARGVHLPPGRQLVLAGLRMLSPTPQPVREAIMPVSLAVVGPAFGCMTFGWVHDVWNECGLLTRGLRQWMLGTLASAGELVLRPIQVADAGPPAPAVKPSSADGSDFLSAAAARMHDRR